MNKSSNITIILLSLTACMLLIAILMTQVSPVQAGTAESRGDEYTMTAGSIAASTELIYIIDIPAQRLQGYAVNRNTNAIEMVAGASVDLRQAFEGGAGATSGTERRGR